MEYLAFERQLLRLMFRTNAPLTPVHVAYYLDIPVAEARAHLDTMVSNGILELDSDDSGHLIYNYPMRPDPSTLPPPPRRRRRRKRRRASPRALASDVRPAALSTSLVSAASQSSSALGQDVVWEDRRYSPAAAAALSFFLPGVGQIYSGRVPQGIGWMLATGLGYLLFLVPGLILHICCVVNAAAVPSRLPGLAERVR